MISYEPLWQTMKEQNISTYKLIKYYGLSPRLINDLKHNRGINIHTLEKLCEILNCTPNDVVKFSKEEI